MDKYYGSVLEWRDYEYFMCNEKEQLGVIKKLTRKGFYHPDGTANEEKIKGEANHLAMQLAVRITAKQKMRNFGLQKIRDSIIKLCEDDNLTVLYFYIAYLYGSVYWRMPYNFQRFPAAQNFLLIFLCEFAKTLIENLQIPEDANSGAQDVEEEIREVEAEVGGADADVLEETKK